MTKYAFEAGWDNFCGDLIVKNPKVINIILSIIKSLSIACTSLIALVGVYYLFFKSMPYGSGADVIRTISMSLGFAHYFWFEQKK